MIALEPLTQAHMERFPIPGLLLDLWEDKAVAFVEDGNVLGVCGCSVDGDTAEVGMFLDPRLRLHPAFLFRTALHGIEGLRLQGIKCIKAQAEELPRDDRWLQRLGFVKTDDGYVKWLQAQS